MIESLKVISIFLSDSMWLKRDNAYIVSIIEHKFISTKTLTKATNNNNQHMPSSHTTTLKFGCV